MQPEEQWPADPDGLKELPEQDDLEVKRNILANAVCAREETHSVSQLINHTSWWERLKKVMGWILRFKNLVIDLWKKRKEVNALLAHSCVDEKKQEDVLRKELQSVKDSLHCLLTVDELKEAELESIRICQRKKFPDEFSRVQREQNVKQTSHINKLNPVLDDGVL